MNKAILTPILCTLGIIGLFGAGYFVCLKINTDYIESFKFQCELINTQQEALDAAHKVMINNELLDTDGTDEMSDFLSLQSKVDSLYNTQF